VFKKQSAIPFLTPIRTEAHCEQGYEHGGVPGPEIVWEDKGEVVGYERSKDTEREGHFIYGANNARHFHEVPHSQIRPPCFQLIPIQQRNSMIQSKPFALLCNQRFG